ncbi:MAG: hypothetical protein BWZ02_00345 [Lentisphaerae bacterium ADurb.BinA184]|nr:MAG: hypothetical protein BWZ02_00345 [Lentisphaerae bacterium ADurb.BinA184]
MRTAACLLRLVARALPAVAAGLLAGRALETPAQEPAPAAGRAGAILFLSPGPQMDAAYAKELADAGWAAATASYWDVLDPAFLRRFNVFVFDALPQAGQRQETFGHHVLAYWANRREILALVEAGAGLLVYADLVGGGGQGQGWNEEMERWGIEMRQACVRDPATLFGTWKAYGENGICWTEAVAPHDVTAGIKRVYYAGANARWDDCYTTTPLVCSDAWTPLVKAGPGARAMFAVDDGWVEDPDTTGDLTLAAVRPLGKGRLAAVSISPHYIHRLGYTRMEKLWYGEMSLGLMDGVVLSQGDGTVPSDTGRLILNLYAWLAAGSGAAGLGGYHAGDPVVKVPPTPTDEERRFSPVLDFDDLVMPRSWRHRPTAVTVDGKGYYPEFSDPFITGDIRMLKALVGVHSGASDGAGTVAEFATAARQAGYAVVAFTEALEALDRGRWRQLVADCAAHSDDSLVCLPGIDMTDVDGNHLLIIAPPYYPRISWLTADGKRLVHTQMINLLYGNHLVVAHRAATGPLPFERLKHFQGLSIYTYRGGQLVDDGFEAYAWQAMNGSNPHPVVVHEVFKPADVAVAAATGFQQILPADTPQNAADYFRAGIAHYFEAPARMLISEGPVVATWVINPKDAGPAAENRQQFRVDVGVHSDAPLKEVVLYDGPTPVRRWLPKGPALKVSAHFRHARQVGLFLTVTDANGRRAVTSSLRTVPERFHFRCSDRQNWLGHVGAYYTGTDLPNRVPLGLPIKGTAEGSAIFTDKPGTCMAVKLNFPFTTPDVALTEAILDERYVRAIFRDVGYDAKPSQASEPSTVYTGKVRNWSFAPGKPGQPYVNLMEFDVTLKRDVELAAPDRPFPSFGGARTKLWAWTGADGTLTTGEIKPDTVLDIPVGGLIGGYIATSPNLCLDRGTFGIRRPDGQPASLTAGTRFQASFLLPAGAMPINQVGPVFDEAPGKWLAAMGFAGPTPYTLTLRRGRLDGIAFVAHTTAADGAVAGEVSRTADIPYCVPVAVGPVNPRWPAGVWRPGSLAFTGVFEGVAWPRLDVAVAGPFVAGNLVTADRPELGIEVVGWTRDRFRLEVHNPTDAEVKASLVSPPEITDLKPVKTTVAVPAGSTVYVTE